MEMQVDLLAKAKNRKSRYIWAIFGIILILSSAAFFIYKRNTTQLVFIAVYTMLWVPNLIEGLGLGKAYILINSEFISLKSHVLEKKQHIEWKDIKSIEYNVIKFDVLKTDNTRTSINVTKFDYVLIKEIKGTIISIAKDKNLLSNNLKSDFFN